jgi:hypothetical protein
MDAKLLLPCFTARIALSDESSRQLLCGQLATVGFRSSHDCVALHGWRSMIGWIRSQLEAYGAH